MGEIPTEKEASVRFYEDRYRHGYMGFWSSFERQRISNLVKELRLPDRGKFLDFGCGRGIFTAVIAEALPGWEIFGCDVSETAIERAQINNPSGTFYLVSDPELKKHRFDFIHSHHVLEHTADLNETLRLMLNLAAPSCTMLHSLPCNHAGSLEQVISSRRKNGINPTTGTFFFEDDAHLRRMSEQQLSEFFRSQGFKLKAENYANHYYGAIKWISESDLRLVLNFTATEPKLRLFLLFTWFCFFTAGAFDTQDRGKYFRIKRIVQVLMAVVFFWLAFTVRGYYLRKARSEWKNRRKERGGSEMFLAYSR